MGSRLVVGRANGQSTIGRTRKWVIPALLTILLSACARTPPPPLPPAETLFIAGASAMAPLLEQLVEGFAARQPSVAVRVETYNTARGLEQLAEGAAALAAVAGPPPEGAWAAPVAVDAIAVVVHADNPLEALTMAQLYEVFVGRTWHWSDLGVVMDDDEITVLSREAGSSARAAFEAQAMAQGPGCRTIAAVELGAAGGESGAALGEQATAAERPGCKPDPVTSTAILRLGSAAVVEYVAQHPAAICYVARGHLEGSASVKALRIEGVPPTAEQVADGSYRLSLPFYLVAPQEPSGAARQFVDYGLSDRGQALVARQYMPVLPE